MERVDHGSLAWRVEEACLNAWPALQEIHYDGWLMRFADGHTRRVNSVNVLRDGALPLAEKIAYCEALYRRHSLRPYFRILSTANPELEDALGARGYAPEDETRTVFMDFDEYPPPSPFMPVELDPYGPSAAWLSAYARIHAQEPHDSVTLERILNQLTLPGVYAAVRDAQGRIVSIAKGAVHDGIGCLNMVATDPAARRLGYSRACVTAVLQWARDEMAASGACLQVVAVNTPAVRLYEELGFVHELYRYHYRTPAA
jgi:N-acetylglutamate synthase